MKITLTKRILRSIKNYFRYELEDVGVGDRKTGPELELGNVPTMSSSSTETTKI